MGFQFDVDWQNLGIGYGAGLLTGYIVYRSRGALGDIRRALTSQGDSGQSFATMGGDRRYTNELTKYAQQSHLFYDAIELSDILVEPRFIADREVAVSSDEDADRRNPFEFVPIVPDHPHLHQPYNMNTINIEELGYGERAVALLGLPGSGRTTALLSIALWSMGKIDFDPVDDPVQKRLQEEEENLSRQDRDERAKARIAIEQRAKEQLREELGREVGDEMQSAFIPPFRQMVPIYVHLSNINLNSRSLRGNVDPAEPLVRAIQYQAGSITSKTVPRKIYRFLNQGVCLVLLDGLDELPVTEQRQKIEWLHAFLDEYNQNFVIVAGVTSGYGVLQQVGFTPIHLRPWSYQDTKTYVQKLSKHWGEIISQRRFTVDEDRQNEILEGLWGLNPSEITMKIHSQLSNGGLDTEAEDFSAWTLNYIVNRFDDAEDALSTMTYAASIQLDNHYFTINDCLDIESTQAIGSLSKLSHTDTEDNQESSDSGIDDNFRSSSSDDLEYSNEDIDDMFVTDDLENDEEFGVFEDAEITENARNTSDFSDFDSFPEDETAEKEPQDETNEGRQVRRTVNKLFSAMLKVGLIERYRGNRYRFCQSHVSSYLASRILVNSGETFMLAKAMQPQWSGAFAFASSQINMLPAVETKMSETTDILSKNVLDVAHWLRYGDDRIEWRNKYLTYLGQMFIAPGQYLTSRERIAAALVTARDANTLKIFGRGTQHNNPDIKRLSILAMGTFQQEDLLDNLSYFLDDLADEVRVVAAMAIGNIHTEEAYTLLSEELLNARSESVQQVITETFADKPDVGYEILWEILNNEEYKDRVRLRRAAILGVKRLKTDWSLIEIYRTYLEEQQWYVKSTAQVAFTERQSQRNKGVQAYPQITTLPWLREWSLDLEDERAAEASGKELLNMAIREQDPVIRYLATSNSGQLGVYENMPDIYNLLNDPEDAIRDTAFRALVDLQMRMGKPLPLPH